MKIIDRFVGKLFKLNLQSRLVVGFLIATFLTGFVATLISIWTINKSTIDEVQNRVRQDINTAKLIYNQTLEKIASHILFTAERSDLQVIMAGRDYSKMENLRGLIRHEHKRETQDDDIYLDMITVVDARGNVLYRAANPDIRGDSMLWSPVIKNCLEKKSPQFSTELMSTKKILRENPGIAERVTMEITKIPLSYEPGEKQLSDGMVMMAAYPLFDNKKNLLGAIVGGVLLNKDYTIVDKVKETVYQGEKYKGREMGVATIFQGGVRISTNVMTKENKRAIGTTLSKEVYDRVIVEGKDWVGRAFVVDDWYITTYTPIYDMNKNLIGILYVGLLEAKYRDIKWNTIWINLGITSLGMAIAFVISFYLGNTIIKRIRMLKEAAESIAAGNLDYKLSPDKISGFDMLDEAFNYMSKSLKDHDEKLHKAHQQLAKTEKLTALGGMAAGVAHEINNPLGGILLYSNLVLEDIAEDSPARENMEKIIYQTNRCKEIVQNLLDFARTPTGEMLPLNINNVIKTSLNLVKDQSMFHGIEIDTRLAENLPEVIGDKSRLEEVFVNLFVNAADAMKGKGKLTITTMPGTNNSVKILVSDTGTGIDEEHLPHIFEPFFTTKEPGRGTGLGLSIAYGIIRKHNGAIDAESGPGKGTTFIIFLPVYMGKYSGMDEDVFYS
ncbi:MAG: cache domain-containing protein [Deltaproteobacteria bacterium]|nr:cache domain-containing protein [Deltaproteobacteria bacterium]